MKSTKLRTQVVLFLSTFTFNIFAAASYKGASYTCPSFLTDKVLKELFEIKKEGVSDIHEKWVSFNHLPETTKLLEYNLTFDDLDDTTSLEFSDGNRLIGFLLEQKVHQQNTLSNGILAESQLHCTYRVDVISNDDIYNTVVKETLNSESENYFILKKSTLGAMNLKTKVTVRSRDFTGAWPLENRTLEGQIVKLTNQNSWKAEPCSTSQSELSSSSPQIIRYKKPSSPMLTRVTSFFSKK